MTKAAVKERPASPSLFAEMKEAPAPKKPDETKPKSKTSKPKASTSTALTTERVAAPAKRAEPTSLLAVIMNAVSDPRCDTGKMRELLAMQREIDQEEARRAFVSDFMALTDDLPSVSADRAIVIRKKDPRTGERTGAVEQSTPYATFNAMMRVLKKPLKTHGFSLSYSTEPGADGRMNVIVYLDHIRGHQRKTIFPLPADTTGSKNNNQGWGSAQAYGMRYGTRALLNIITSAPEDADTDGTVVAQVEGGGDVKELDAPKKLPADDVKNLKEKMRAAGITAAQFCEKYGLQDVGDLPPAKYDDAVAAIENHVRLKNEAKKK